MSQKVIWINPYITDIYMVPEGTVLPLGMSEDGGTLIIEHDDDLMLAMDSPLDARDFLKTALAKVDEYIEKNGIEA